MTGSAMDMPVLPCPACVFRVIMRRLITGHCGEMQLRKNHRRRCVTQARRARLAGKAGRSRTSRITVLELFCTNVKCKVKQWGEPLR